MKDRKAYYSQQKAVTERNRPRRVRTHLARVGRRKERDLAAEAAFERIAGRPWTGWPQERIEPPRPQR